MYVLVKYLAIARCEVMAVAIVKFSADAESEVKFAPHCPQATSLRSYFTTQSVTSLAHKGKLS